MIAGKNNQANIVLDKSRRIAMVEREMKKAIVLQASAASILEFRNQIDAIIQEDPLKIPAFNLNNKVKKATRARATKAKA